MECPNCGETAPAGMKWCEACGSDLSAAPAVPCVSCGERDISEDGYCMSCGHKQPEERDHMVFEAGSTVAITDRGLRHRHNEDAAAVADLPGGGAVLVVCDGVSSTPGSAEASLAAATAARDLLVDRLAGAVSASGPNGAEVSSTTTPAAIMPPLQPDGAESAPAGAGSTGDGAGPGASAESAEVVTADPLQYVAGDAVNEALVAATAAAQEHAAAAPEVASNAPHSQGGPPSSTFVAAVARPVAEGVELSVAWLGDSRAYWVASDGALQLTGDHEIEGSLTRWLGADSIDVQPDLTRYIAPGPGRLLLCSDGLWRYADPPTELATLVGRLESEHSTTVGLAGALVGHAVDSGGHDNITVALWPSSPPSDEATAVPDASGPEESETSR